MLSAIYHAQTSQIPHLAGVFGKCAWRAVPLLYPGIRTGITNWSSHDGTQHPFDVRRLLPRSGGSEVMTKPWAAGPEGAADPWDRKAWEWSKPLATSDPQSLGGRKTRQAL